MVERDQRQRRCEQRRDPAQPEVRLLRVLQEIVAEPAAGERSDEAGDEHDLAEGERGVFQRHPAHPLHECRRPDTEPSEGERPHRVTDAGEEVLAVFEEAEVALEDRGGRWELGGGSWNLGGPSLLRAPCSPLPASSSPIVQPPRHVTHEHHEQREQQSRRAGDPECGAPVAAGAPWFAPRRRPAD